MAAAEDLGQIIGLVLFERLASSWDSDLAFLVCGLVVILCSTLQFFSYRLIDRKCLPPEVASQ